jgi:hypothetical protein
MYSLIFNLLKKNWNNIINLIIFSNCIYNGFYATSFVPIFIVLTFYYISEIMNNYYGKMYLLHHICVLLTITFSLFYVDPNDLLFLEFTKKGLLVQISSIFLILKPYFIRFKIISILNKTLFITTFFLFRIYYGYFLIQDYNYVIDLYCDSFLKKLYYYTGHYGLYLINIYWSILILKILSKPILKSNLFKSWDTPFSILYLNFFCWNFNLNSLLYLFTIIIIYKIKPFYHLNTFFINTITIFNILYTTYKTLFF